jgi:hypothetical protein
LTEAVVKSKGFISETLKNKLEEPEDNGIPQAVKDFWNKMEDSE